MNEGIGMREWVGYYRRLLGGVEWRVRNGEEIRRREDGEAEI